MAGATAEPFDDDDAGLITIDPGEVAIEREAVARLLGYPDGHLPEPFGDMIDGVIAHAPVLLEIQAGYRIVPLEAAVAREGWFQAGGVRFQAEPVVTSRLRGASQVALMVCSIGPGMEGWAHRCHCEGDPVMSYFVDAVASVAVEAVADLLHGRLTRRYAALGMGVTNRYSPGYCGWPVAEQKKLFGPLPERFCGVSLTESALMMPVKSVSGIAGAGRDAVFKPYSCETCGKTGCTQKAILERRKASAKEGR